MKRWISLTLSLLLVLGLCGNAFATDDAADEADTLSWENLHSRVKTGSLSTQQLSEQVASLEAIDYEKMLDDLKKQLNDLSSLQWYIVVSGGIGNYESEMYDNLRDVYESVRDGELQQDNAETIAQLEYASAQILLAADCLYLNILMLEQSITLQEQALSSTERSIQEADLYEQLGMASGYDLSELQASKTQLESSIASARINLRSSKAQLQQLIGESVTGELSLSMPLTLDEMPAERNYAADLEAAKTESWSLSHAARVRDDAQEDFTDIKKDYAAGSYQYQSAEHTWQAAQLSYESSVQEFERAFLNLHLSLADAMQQFESKRSALVHEAFRVQIAQLRFEQGMISRSALLSAQEQQQSTQCEQSLAQLQLFLAYHCYTQAVEQGILAG